MPKFVKGQSGNPKGRPKRALSIILAQRGQECKRRATTVGTMDISDQAYIAEKVWHLATEGWVELDGEVYRVRSLREWLGVVKFLYEQIDGKAMQDIGGEMVVQVVRGNGTPAEIIE